MTTFILIKTLKTIGPLGRKVFSKTWTRSSSAQASPGGFNMSLTDEQREMQDLARKFTREEIIPKAQHHDETGEFPWDIVKKAHAVGLMNGHISQEFGELLYNSYLPI